MLRGLRLFSTAAVRLNTLALLEVVNGKINPNGLSTINACQQLGKPVDALIIGQQASQIVEQVAKINGISKVIVAPSEKYDHYLPENVTPLILKLLTNQDNKYSHFLISASNIGKSILPRVGALMDLQPISDVIKIVDDKTFVRPIYAGNVFATVKTNDDIVLASIRASAFPQTIEEGAPASIEKFEQDKDLPQGRTNFVSENLVTSSRPELGSATRIVAGGRGLKNKETFSQIIEPLATKLNAAIGASRAAVDSGFVDNSLQIGQTGKIVAPDLYVAVGISGAIQHLAGMKDSKVIVAINKDPDAPIFNVADFSLQADLLEVVPELTDKL